MTKTKPEVVRGRTTELRVYPQGNQLNFIPPLQRPHNYQTVGRGILARDLSLPTGEQTAYLAQGAYESEEPEFEEVKDIMEIRWFWVFNRNLWTSDGVYVAHDPNAVGLSQGLIENELESILSDGTELNGVRFSKDGNVRFAPRETYRLGEHTPESLANDGFVIASYGVKGAEALSDVAEKILSRDGRGPFTYGVNVEKGQNPEQRVSSLYSDWDEHGLFVDGYYRGYDGDGCAFGVLESTAGAAQVFEDPTTLNFQI